MATRMPDTGTAQHIASVNYLCTFWQISAASGPVTFACPNPVQFVFAFETGRTQPDPSKDLWDVSWDYSWFDQDAIEQSIAIALGAICEAIATMLGLPVSDVEQSVAVQRSWAVAANIQGNAAASQYSSGTVTEVMPYPPQVSSADVAAAAESGSVSTV